MKSLRKRTRSSPIYGALFPATMEVVNHRGKLVLSFFVEILAERDPAKLAR